MFRNRSAALSSTALSGKACLTSGDTHNRRGRALQQRRKALAFESLEQRQMLAIDVQIRLQATDLAGANITSITPNTDFLLKAFVKDLRATPQGVLAAYLDINFNAALAEANGAIDYDTLYEQAPDGDTNTPGLINNIGSCDTDNTAPANPGDEFLLFTVPMKSKIAGTLNFTTDPADNLPLDEIKLFPSITVPTTDVSYVGTSLEINTPPVAVADNASTTEDATKVIDAKANDTDAESHTLTITAVDATSTKGATITIQGDGTLLYNPTAAGDLQKLAGGATTNDTFTYTISDGHGGTHTATVTVEVTGVNDIPDANDDTGAINENFLLSVNAADGLLKNDVEVDTGNTLTVSNFDAASAKGAVVTVAADGSYTYDPTNSATLQALTPGQTTTDTFTYTISDGSATAVATVTITVTGVNHPPVGNDDSYTALADELLTVAESDGVLKNDTDAEGHTLSIVSFTASSQRGATVNVSPNGRFNYDPTTSTVLAQLKQGETLTDFFTYNVSDGNGGTDVATVNLTVTGVNDPPDALDDAFSTPANQLLSINAPGVRANDNDPDNASDITVTTLNITSSLGAPVVMNANGGFSYDPRNVNAFKNLQTGQTINDTFQYTLSDGAGGSDSATVTISVSGVASGFQAIDDTATINEDADALLIDVLANDAGSNLAISSVGNGSAQGTISISNGKISYKPRANFSGIETFNYVITQGTATETRTAQVAVQVNAQNDAPVNNLPATQSTLPGTALLFNSTNNNLIRITDEDSNTDDIQVTLTATGGVLTLGSTAGLSFSAGDGTDDATTTMTGTLAEVNAALNGLKFQPAAGFTGNASIAVNTSDLGKNGSGGIKSDTDSLTISVSLASSSLKGQLFIDVDGNGQKGANELVLPSVDITATRTSGGEAISRTVQTNDSGEFAFDSLPAGTYEIEYDPFQSLAVGTAVPGSAGGTPDRVKVSGITLGANQTGDNYKFPSMGAKPQFVTIRLFLNTTPTGTDLLDQIESEVPDSTQTLMLAYRPKAALASRTSPAPVINLAQAQPVANAAIARLEKAGLPAASAAKLRQARIVQADLPNGQLAAASRNKITLDTNASGLGWFIDPTPLLDEEFAPVGSALSANVGLAATGVDLLTALSHEYLHLLGAGHAEDDTSLLAESLAVGTRKEPSPELISQALDLL